MYLEGSSHGLIDAFLGGTEEYHKKIRISDAPAEFRKKKSYL
jgi:hypothetical protein